MRVCGEQDDAGDSGEHVFICPAGGEPGINTVGITRGGEE